MAAQDLPSIGIVNLKADVLTIWDYNYR